MKSTKSVKMKVKLKLILLVVICLILVACSISKNNVEESNWKPKIQVQAGINHGDIIDNTDMSELENTDAAASGPVDTEVDAFSGATKIGANIGMHVLFPVRKNNIETGIDYMLSNQTLNYNSDILGYQGSRKINTSQFIIPVTYNFSCFTKKYDDGLFQIKLGYLMQLNMFAVSNSGTLPDYSTTGFSCGPVFGISTTALKLSNGSSLGLYFDVYRGSQIYEDLYNQKDFEMPGSSFFKAGVIYRFTKN